MSVSTPKLSVSREFVHGMVFIKERWEANIKMIEGSWSFRVSIHHNFWSNDSEGSKFGAWMISF